jgi:hypothetical protein
MSPFDTLYTGLTLHRAPDVIANDNHHAAANDNAVNDAISRGAYHLVQATGWAIGSLGAPRR